MLNSVSVMQILLLEVGGDIYVSTLQKLSIMPCIMQTCIYLHEPPCSKSTTSTSASVNSNTELDQNRVQMRKEVGGEQE